MNTCYECTFFSIRTGRCEMHNILRHSCGEDACDDFELAPDLKQYGEFIQTAVLQEVKRA